MVPSTTAMTDDRGECAESVDMGVRTLVVGLGNPILGDDGVGWRVAEELARDFEASPVAHGLDRMTVDVEPFSLGGLSLMERMIGYDRAIVIDAITTGRPVGAVVVMAIEDVDTRVDQTFVHATAAHDTSLRNALRLGRDLGAKLPARVHVVGIEASALYDFSEELTPEVARAVPIAKERVGALLRDG